MFYVFLALSGLLAGFLGGMGMGGGTLLIPLLTLALNFNQKIAQGLNLISFCIMAGIVLIIHIKNGLVNLKTTWRFALFALPASVGGALLANVLKAGVLKTLFGVLLVLVAIYQTVMEIIAIHRENNKKNAK